MRVLGLEGCGVTKIWDGGVLGADPDAHLYVAEVHLGNKYGTKVRVGIDELG